MAHRGFVGSFGFSCPGACANCGICLHNWIWKQPQCSFSTSMARSTGSAAWDPSTGKHRGTLFTTKSHGQSCPCWQTLFPLGCLQKQPIKYEFCTSLARADACMEAQVTLVRNNAQQPGTFCCWATEAMSNTALLFTGHLLCLVQLLPKPLQHKIQFLWVAAAVLSNAMLLLLLSRRGERNIRELSHRGLWHFLPAHTNKSDVCDYLGCSQECFYCRHKQESYE